MSAPAASPFPAPAPPLVGRERELSALRDVLTAALAGRGGLVLIGGEAGIGKTALAEALCAEAARRGALVLVGRCYDLSETPPYGPWAEALARAPLGDPPPVRPSFAGAAATSQAALFGQVRDYLAALAAGWPALLLLEDLHWADPASLDLLRVVARGLGDLPLLLLATYRADEVAGDHPLAVLLPLLVREARAERLDLRPLADDDLRTLIRPRYGLAPADEDRLVDFLAGRSEGNPLYAGEVLRALEEADLLRRDSGGARELGDLAAARVPALLRQVIDGRVARLGDGARELLVAAAVLGQEVPLVLWAAVSGAPEDDLIGVAERAIAARLLTEKPDGAGVRFEHALIREALYEGLGALRRPGWHRKAAEALAATAAPDPDAVAYHYQRAGDPRALDWLIRAGERAWRSSAWLSAAARYEAALPLLAQRAGEARRQALVLLTLAQLRRFEDPDWGVGQADEAERQALAVGDEELAAAARFDRGHLRVLAGSVRRGGTGGSGQGLAEMASALPILERLEPHARAELPALLIQGARGEELYHRGALMFWLGVAGRYREAMALADPMIARGPGATPRGLAALGSIYAHFGQPELAERAIMDAQRVCDAAGQWVEAHNRRLERLGLAFRHYPDEPARWEPLIQEAEAVAGRAAGAQSVVVDYDFAPNLLLVRGAWAELAEIAGTPGGRWFRGLLAHLQGDEATAWAEIRHYLPQGPATEWGDHSTQATQYPLVAAALSLASGDRASACAWLGAYDRWLAWSGAVVDEPAGYLGWAAYHRATGSLAQARESAEHALERATAPRQPLALLAARRLLGELDTAAGRLAEAQDNLPAALSLADACAAPYERALTLLAFAELHLATGARAEADSALDEARVLLVPLEARPALARADALAARLAASAPPSVPAALPFGLTAREAEVLRLLAEGLPDAQIAARLFVSRNTVNSHAKAIFGKLGVTTRAAAARVATEHGLA